MRVVRRSPVVGALLLRATLEAQHAVGFPPAGYLMLLSGNISPTGQVIPQAIVRTNAPGIAPPTFVVRSTA